MAKKEKTYASVEEFKKAVLAAKQLIAENIAKVRISSVGQFVGISLDEQSFEKKDFQGIEKDRLKELLGIEIPAVIAATLHGKFNMIDFYIFLHDMTEEIRKEIRKAFDEKIEFVKQELITPPLKQRYLLRVVSKNDILDKLEWDIGYKSHDLEKGPIERLPFATLQFICNKSRTTPSAWMVGVFSDKEQKSMTIDVHLEDLEQLIDDLSVLKDTLKKELKG
ncbi:MAG: hypothetical protein HY886_03190 [Deltaproteobacteria bacterium]|nr:hypothetical protein [Deltaproteobacteria bacterium]